ncbi:MAG: hypothetical protein ACM3P0_17680 [Acidobacteriota bacterium]
MSNNSIERSWNSLLNYKVQLIHSQIAALQMWVEKNNGSSELFNSLAKPYYSLLEELYEEDYPLAKAIDTSDLLLRLEGPKTIIQNPRLSMITGVFGSVRKQVTNLTKAFSDLLESKVKIPKELDLGLSAVARGSLVLGFTLPPADSIRIKNEPSLLGEADPLYQASKKAVQTLGVVTKLVSEEDMEELDKEIIDPKIKDVALLAVKNLAPSGRTGIDRVNVSGKDFRGAGVSILTKEVRKNISQVLKHPVKSDEIITLRGTVREIDLDARRFELRGIQGHDILDIRCIYSIEDEAKATDILNKRVKIKGRIDRSESGKPRLLEMISMDLLS